MVFLNAWQTANINLDDHVRREQKTLFLQKSWWPAMFCSQFDYCKEIEDKKVIEKDWDNKQNPIIDPINQDYIEIINNDSIQKLEENAQYFIDTFLSKK